jgi:transglutaminase-like putative cysteine protease
MPLLTTLHPLADYLRSGPSIGHDNEEVRRLLDERGWSALDEVEATRRAFEFVRDEVRHSWDIRSHRITRTAGDVLRHREGLCFAKAMLLAALLRALRIPSGLTHQRLTLGDTAATGFSVHGLNTVYLAPLERWIRLDARGNKAGIDAQFSLDEEKLAFLARTEHGEVDYLDNLPEPHPVVARALERHVDLFELVEALPEHL